MPALQTVSQAEKEQREYCQFFTQKKTLLSFLIAVGHQTNQEPSPNSVFPPQSGFSSSFLGQKFSQPFPHLDKKQS